MFLVQRQSTLRAVAVFEGVELHGGNHTRITLRPAPINTGLCFVRTDIKDRENKIFLSPRAVTDVTNCSTICNSHNVCVSTVEHLLAALAAAGIDNLYIDVDGHELPALDGSSGPFLDLIETTGIDKQNAPRRYLEVLKTIDVERGESHGRIEPADRLVLDVTIDFDDKAIGRQSLVIAPDVRAFREGVASARTFARKHEIAALRAAGLSKGGSLDNAIVVDGDKVLNPGGLRFADEFVRHKALDLMGDLYMAGPVLGKVTTFKGGHGLNHDLIMALMADQSAWRYRSIQEIALDEQKIRA